MATVDSRRCAQPTPSNAGTTFESRRGHPGYENEKSPLRLGPLTSFIGDEPACDSFDGVGWLLSAVEKHRRRIVPCSMIGRRHVLVGRLDM